MILGYHVAHEQYAAEQALHNLRAAERAGFRTAMCSDHLSPFLPEQGHSNHAWTWLGAAMTATDMDLGTVSAPGHRYHPAVLAQAIATAARLAPGAFWVALGSGENINEHVTGRAWPDKAARNQVLLESQNVMRQLLRGEPADHRGSITVHRARLHSPPRDAPPLLGAAMTPDTAAWLAGWADGLITVNQPTDRLEEIVEAYRSAGGRGPLYLQVQLSWHPDEDEALRAAHQEWRFAALEPERMERLETPDMVAAATADVQSDDLREPVLIMTDLDGLHDHARAWHRLGFETAFLHNVGRNQEAFLQAAARDVVPHHEVAAPA